MSRNNVKKYLLKRAELERWPLVYGSLDGLNGVVVIPALAEYDSLFDTLESLGKNPPEELNQTLIIVVVNNGPSCEQDKCVLDNNQETLLRLHSMFNQQSSPMRIGYIDASSPGRELSRGDGVGMARKIGLDTGLVLLNKGSGGGLLINLDADTLVDADYLSAIRGYYKSVKAWAGVVDYKHRMDGSTEEQAAITRYELFLRYYVSGLKYACSPYAYHTIGSTIVCTTDAYVAVSGMNRRQAGEDFYFLQELAKTGGVGHISNTTVHPSSRVSSRVLFGTGPTVGRYINGDDEQYFLFDPQSYCILKQWLNFITEEHGRSGSELMSGAKKICPQLADFLEINKFEQTWERIVKNSSGSANLISQFHRWFDALKTLKFLHYLRDNGYPKVNMFDAIRELPGCMGQTMISIDSSKIGDDLTAQIAILEDLRTI